MPSYFSFRWWVNWSLIYQRKWYLQNRFACNKNAFSTTCFSHNLLPLICLTDIDRPKGLAFTDVDVDSIKIAWESPQGQVSGYRVTYSSPEDGIHELFPAPDGEEDTAELQGLRPGSEYTVSVVALHDDMESEPLIGTQSTGISVLMPRALLGAAASCLAAVILSNHNLQSCVYYE